MSEEETVENVILGENIANENFLQTQITIQQSKKRRRKLFDWLRNLTPFQLKKVLCFLAIGFRRYAAQFIGLVDRESHSKRKINNNLSVHLALKLKRNAFLIFTQQKILPRFAPFSCSKCGFSSRKLNSIIKHICTTKRAHEYKSVVHTATLGYRSRCRDALAIMERIPRPQSITNYLINNIYEINNKGEELIKNITNQLKQPKTLRDITLIIIHNLLGFNNNYEIIKTKSLNKLIETTEEFKNEEEKREGKEEENKKEKNNFKVVCTKCFSTNFSSRAEFHAHIFKCAFTDRENNNNMTK